ncbi:MAG: DUF2779 domain-containing protein [Gammaproteobacteria bacterium]|jgi:hypothetical protein
MQLSKSQYLRGLQCPKALWLFKYRQELAAEPDARRQHLFDTGHRVGALAQQLFPGGVEVAYRAGDYPGMIDETAQSIHRGGVVYEGSFAADGVFVRADILVPNGDAWDLYEVKATASTKPVHKPDVAVQWYVIGRHLPLGRAHLVHLNTSYVRDGALDVRDLFTIDDVTEAVEDQQAAIERNLRQLETVLAGAEPEVPIGTQCNNPYECDFRAHCWRNVPYPSVLDLCRLNGDRKFEYYHRGIVTYEDARNHIELNAVQSLQVNTALNQTVHIDAGAIADFLRNVRFPVHFLDFETFQDAIPRFDGQRPYQNMPFQYSLHVVHGTGELEHREFLADENEDPRLELARRLVDDLGDEGTIFAYHQQFELGVVRGLARDCAEFDARLMALTHRFEDLEVPFKNLMYYHPDFHGSFSIKSVLPALFPGDPELDYKNLAIRSGDEAMNVFPRLREIDDPDEKAAIRDALRAYCRLDTLAMVKLWEKLKGVIPDRVRPT